MGIHKLRILHLSDLHERVFLPGQPGMNPERSAKILNGAAARHRVLEDSFKKALEEIKQAGKIDLVCFSGDAADWGLPEEYAKVTARLEMVLNTLEMGWEQLFLIPGNHDVQRYQAADSWTPLRPLANQNPDIAGRWMFNEGTPAGFQTTWRDQILERTQAFWNWVENNLNRAELKPDPTDGRLGYRITRKLERLPFALHVIGLDSAWLCGDDADTGKLLLTSTQIDRRTRDENGKLLEGFRLCMVHHPLTDLSDGTRARELLSDSVDLLLHGHQHNPVASEIQDPDRNLRVLAAGSLFEGDAGDKWLNSFHVIEAHLNDQGRPLKYELEFWGWSDRGFWHRTGAIYQHAPNGQLTWKTKLGDQELTSPKPMLERPETKPIFVGRQAELERLEQLLLPETTQPVAVCSLHGMAGVGKSWLVEHFHALHQTHFGKLLNLVLERERTPTANELLNRLADQSNPPAGEGSLEQRLHAHLHELHPLIHLENIDSQALAVVAGELSQKLTGVPFVITGRYAGFSSNPHWTTVAIAAFDLSEGIQQLEQELNKDAPRLTQTDKQELIGALGGLPLAIHLAAGYLNAGHTAQSFLGLLKQRGLEIEPFAANDANYSQRSQRALSATFEISLQLLEQTLQHEQLEVQTVHALGLAPRAGFGLKLAAAIGNSEENQMRQTLIAASSLSVIERVPSSERNDAWRVHPLIGEHLQNKLELENREATRERLHTWFEQRIVELEEEDHPELSDEDRQKLQNQNWQEASDEQPGLVEWLNELEPSKARGIASLGYWYSLRRGPYRTWKELAERGLKQQPSEQEQSRVLWVLGHLAVHCGDFEDGINAAEQKANLEKSLGNEIEHAMALGLKSDILFMQGHLDQSLDIRKLILSVFDSQGQIREAILVRGKIADILEFQGQLDNALNIRRELPQLLEDLSDIREATISRGKIASILEIQEKFDEALNMRREQLPIFERIGDIPEAAFVRAKIADILEYQENFDEAFDIRTELAVLYDKLGDVRLAAYIRVANVNILMVQGLLDVATVTCKEQLRIFKNLGDVKGIATTQSKIALILWNQKNYNCAVETLQNETIPAYVQLGDKRNLLNQKVFLARMIYNRGQPNDRFEALQLLRQAFQAAQEMQIPVATEIQEMIAEHFGTQP